jgi:outer membrane protein assembly factor BamB
VQARIGVTGDDDDHSRGMSRRTLLALVGGGVLVAGGVATTVALTSGHKNDVVDPSVAAGPPGTLVGPDAHPVWTATLNEFTAGLAVSSGTLLVVGYRTTSGLDAKKGGTRWRGTADSGGYVPQTPLITHDTAYVVRGSADTGTSNRLLALNVADGTPRWSLLAPDANWALRAAAGILGNTLFCVATTEQPEIGEVIWAVDLGTHQTRYTATDLLGLLVVPPDGKYLFTRTTDIAALVGGELLSDNINGIDAANGKRVWTQQAPGDFPSSGPGSTFGCYTDGKLYYGGDQLYAVQPATGDPAWPSVVLNPVQDEYYNRPVTDGQGRIFVTSHNVLYALRARDGSTLWQTTGANDFSRYNSRPIAAADGCVYVVDDKAVLYAVDAATGRCRWSYKNPLAGDVALTLTAGEGHVYYGFGYKVVALKCT